MLPDNDYISRISTQQMKLLVLKKLGVNMNTFLKNISSNTFCKQVMIFEHIISNLNV